MRLKSIALIIALMLVGCSNTATRTETKKVKLAFVTNNPSQFWKIAAGGIKKYEQEAKVQIDIKMPAGSPEAQNEVLQTLASQGYDAVSVSVVAPNDQVGVLNKVALSLSTTFWVRHCAAPLGNCTATMKYP